MFPRPADVTLEVVGLPAHFILVLRYHRRDIFTQSHRIPYDPYHSYRMVRTTRTLLPHA
jgi:hypothetical protein